KIGPMVSAVTPFGTGKRLFFPAFKCVPGVTVNLQPSLSAEKEIPQFLTLAAFLVGITAARFKFQHLSVIVLEHGRLDIRCFLRGLVMAVGFYLTVDHFPRRSFTGFGLVLSESVQTTRRIYRFGMFMLVHAPARDVQLVRTRVSGIAVAGIPVPMPVVVASLLIVWPPGCRTKPTLVMKAGRRFAVPGHPVGVPGLETQCPGHIYIPDTAFVQQFDGTSYAGRRAVVQSYLNDTIVLSCSLD